MKQHFGKYLGPTLIDEAQPLTAWRTWRLGYETSGGVASTSRGPVALTGTWATNQIWARDGRATVAECLREKDACNVSMAPECNCGVWAAAAITNLLKHGAIALYPTGVLGRVALWGFVHVYEYGFRAQMGRPRDLWLGNTDGRAIREELGQAYQVPVELGLPVETVVDPGLLTPRKVLAAANAYLVAEHTTATSALRSLSSALPSPVMSFRGRTLRIPASRRKKARPPMTTMADVADV